MLQLDDISVQLGTRAVLDHISLRVGEQDRIAVVGRNGAGKSTLLKAAAALIPIDGGQVSLGRRQDVGYLAQEHLVAGGLSLWDEAMAALGPLLSLERRALELMEHASALPADDPRHEEALHDAAECEERFRQGGGYAAEATVGRVLDGLGFRRDDWTKDASTFSGGWQIRIGLARLLLQKPTFLLLDEPTNHLDLETRTWLLHELKRWPGGVVLISHDRDFVDRLVSRTVLIEGGRTEEGPGGWSAFVAWKAERDERLAVAAERSQAERERVQGFIDRFRYKASKASQVQSRVKALERMEVVDVPKHAARAAKLRFPDPPPCGEPVAELRTVGKRFGEHQVLAGIDESVLRGERILLVGRNGAGKSTLLRILAGVERATSGVVVPGPGVRVAWFAQDQSLELPAGDRVLDVVQRADPLLVPSRLRSLLGALLFSGDDVEKRCGILSGGEKSRVALARILLARANLLLLDEPTNHLDMETKEVLADALAAYAGTIVFVSHDRSFANELATSVWDVGGGTVQRFAGNLDDFLWARAIAAGVVTRRAPGQPAPDDWLLGGLPTPSPASTKAPATAPPNPRAGASPAPASTPLQGERWQDRKVKGREDERRRKRLEASLARVETIDAELAALDARIAEPEVAADWGRLAALLDEREALQHRQAQAMAEWERLEQEAAT